MVCGKKYHNLSFLDDDNDRRNKLDATTMPHQLVRNFYTSGSYYGLRCY